MNIQGSTQSARRDAGDSVSSGKFNRDVTSSGLDGKHTAHHRAMPGRILDVPLWLWPSVFSLDAAFIAALWHTFLAYLMQRHISLAEPLILALSVWIIYVLDHILDSRAAVPVYPEPIRKLFYRQHAKLMLAAAGGGIVIAGVLAVLALPAVIFQLGTAIALYVLIYLGTVHTMPIQRRRSWPREAVVALLFSIGTVLPLAFPSNAQMPVVLACGSLFFLPVLANCCAAEAIDWQRADCHFVAKPHVTAIWVNKHLTEFAGLSVVLAIYFAYSRRVPVPFAAAIILSALALAFVGFQTDRLRPDVRSSLLDAALCSPLLIPLALWHHA